MNSQKWVKGKKFPFPTKNRHGDIIKFTIDCQNDKGNKRFVVRWSDPTEKDARGKSKQKSKTCETFDKAHNWIKDFELKEDIVNSEAKSRVTFLTESQLRDAEMAYSCLPIKIKVKDHPLKEIAEQFVANLPNKEAKIEDVFNEWIQEAERSQKRKSSIESRKDRTREFIAKCGHIYAHKITYKEVEKIVYAKLKNGNDPSNQTIINRHSGVRSLMNRAIEKGYVKKDGNPCETYNGFSDLPSTAPSKTFLMITEAESLIKHAKEYKNGIMLSYFSLACFSGLRPFEIHGGAFRSPSDCDPLKWDDIDLEAEFPEIRVSEDQAKTRTSRWAPIKSYNLNLKKLLLSAKKLGHDLVTIKNFKENWRSVVKLSGLSFNGSDADKCRRSFATYLWNKERSIADLELSKLMGNSPYVLNKHYKSIIKAGEGDKYFGIGNS